VNTTNEECPMYLYGDCTDSKLETNFLGVLPDALDFCVWALLADERVESARAAYLASEREASKEATCLRDVRSRLNEALTCAPTGA
jgi:hypothetical protein